MKKIFAIFSILVFLLAACKRELTPEEKQKVENLKAELILIQNDIEETEKKDAEYSGGAIKALMAVHLEQAKITENLIKQQMASIETGANVKINPIQSAPDPVLAAQMDKEIEDTRLELREAERELDKYSGGAIMAMISVRIATQKITLATLQQRRLAAKYGLNYPYPGAASIAPAKESDSTNKAAAEPEPIKAASLFSESEDEAATEETTGTPKPPFTIQELADHGNERWDIVGNWAIMKEQESIMGDAKNIRILNISPMLHNAGTISSKETQATLRISCENNKTDLSVHLGGMIESSLYDVNLEYKIDDQKIVKSKWASSTNFEGAFSPRPVAFIKELMSAQKIAFRVQKNNSTAVMETYFNLDGLEEAIKPVQEACGWK